MPDTPETQAQIATRIGELEGMIARQLAGIREWERTANNLGKKRWVQRQADINTAYQVLRQQMEEANALRARIGLPLIITPPEPAIHPPNAPGLRFTSNLGCLMLIIGFMAFMGFIAWGNRSGTFRSTPGATSSGDEIMAQVVCQKAVKAQLKAPATAQFDTATRISLGGGRYRVSGPVDAENGFGALLRMSYDCTVVFIGGDNYRIENATVAEP